MSLKSRVEALAASVGARRFEIWIQTSDRQGYELLNDSGDVLTRKQVEERRKAPGVKVMVLDLAPERHQKA